MLDSDWNNLLAAIKVVGAADDTPREKARDTSACVYDVVSWGGRSMAPKSRKVEFVYFFIPFLIVVVVFLFVWRCLRLNLSFQKKL